LDLLRFQIGAHGSAQGIAVSMIVMIGLAIIAAFFLVATPTGRYIHAIGGNEQAARHAGIRVPRVKVTVYALAGLLASVSGIFYVAQYGSMNSGVGPGQELDIIAAAVVGGVSLQGGKGSPIGAIIGAYIITMLRDGLVFNNVPDAGARVAVGAFIILAVVIDRALKGLDGMRLAAMRGRLRR
ncbi:MAG: ABC transporter permease, partial [Chloroflexi bacterium]|nr:ABC transporter permease [Chloroflexota bacterium]